MTKEKEFNLSEKIEVVGFGTEIEFKDKDGNIKMFSATKGEEGIKAKDVKEFIKDIPNGIRKSIERGQFNERYFERWLKKRAGKDLI